MEQKDLQTFKIDKKYHKDILNFTTLNKIEDVDVFINKCFKSGFDIQRFGLLGGETVKEIEKIVEIPVEKIIEITKEVPVEKIVTKIEYICDKIDNPELLLKIQQLENEISKKDKELDVFRRNLEPNLDDNKVKMLETTLQNLRKELKLKNEKIIELEGKLLKQNDRDIDATYLNGSNLNKKL
jgi:hypothetical protein